MFLLLFLLLLCLESSSTVPFSLFDSLTQSYGTTDGYVPELSLSGYGVDVYVMDTGINTSLVYNTEPGIDLIYFSDMGGGYDWNGHGTAVATIIQYFAPDCTIIPVTTMSSTLTGNYLNVMAGFEWVKKSIRSRKRRAIIHTSWDIPTPLNDILDDIKSTIFVASAGNHNIDACTIYPAAINYVVTVGAIFSNNKKTDYSNFGPCVKLYTRGDTAPGHRGTSFAAPIVTGLLATLWGRSIQTKKYDIIANLYSNYTFVGDSGLPILTLTHDVSPDEELPTIYTVARGSPTTPAILIGVTQFTFTASGPWFIPGLLRTGTTGTFTITTSDRYTTFMTYSRVPIQIDIQLER
jgi:subtilisin family serine protease